MALQVISTIVTAAESYDLVNLETVKTELSIPDSDTTNDAWLQTKIDQASQSIQTYCNRVFVQETVQDLIYPDRQYQPMWSLGRFQPLQLSRWPVTSVVSVTVLTVETQTQVPLTAGTDFLLNGVLGQLIRLNSNTGLATSWKPVPTTVQFVAGFSTIPNDIVMAVLDMVTSAFQRRGRDPFLKATEQAGGIGRQEYWIPNNPQGAFPPSVTDIIDKYRQPVTA